MAVTTDEVADRLGLPHPDASSPRAAQWLTWIGQASSQIERYQRIYSLPAPDTNDADFVVLEVVAAMAQHPDDSTQVSVSVDDGQVDRRYSSGNGTINLDRWWDYLWPDNAADREAFSIRPGYRSDWRLSHFRECDRFAGGGWSHEFGEVGDF